jgi:hypothetical protein
MRAFLVASALFIASAASAAEPFTFQSNFWVNLHQFLRAVGRGEPAERNYSLDERATWDAAVAVYRKSYSKRDVLLDDGMVRINDALSALHEGEALPDFPNEPELKATLQSAAPVYKKYFWPAHDTRNRSWIAAAQPLIARYAGTMTAKVAASYGKTWPTRTIVVDIAVQAGPVGAYTTWPPHTTIASTDNGFLGLASVEILFHEASHQWGTVLINGISNAAAAHKKTVPRQLWHAVLFYNAGELMRRTFADDGIVDYTEIATKQLYADLCGEGCRERVAAAWRPHLDGKASVEEAIENLVSDWP